MIFIKTFFLLIAASICIYFLLYLRQLKVIKRAVPEMGIGRLFFLSMLIIIVSGAFGTILFFSIGLDAVMTRFF